LAKASKEGIADIFTYKLFQCKQTIRCLQTHVHIGKVCGQKLQRYCTAIPPSVLYLLCSLLSLATLGSVSWTLSFLFQSLGQGKKGRQYHIVILLTFSHTNFSSVNKPLDAYKLKCTLVKFVGKNISDIIHQYHLPCSISSVPYYPWLPCAV
jgi:hypothetical protein